MLKIWGRRGKVSPTFYLWNSSSKVPYVHRLLYLFTTPIFIGLLAVDGYNLVPNIRPLETLHNSLSLNQITEFFDKIIKVIIDRDTRTKTGRFRTERVGPGPYWRSWVPGSRPGILDYWNKLWNILDFVQSFECNSFLRWTVLEINITKVLSVILIRIRSFQMVLALGLPLVRTIQKLDRQRERDHRTLFNIHRHKVRFFF